MMKTFGFTGADLAANAAGELTARQVPRLRQRYAELETYAFIAGVFPGAMIVLGLVLFAVGELYSEALMARALTLVGGLLLLVLWGGLFIYGRRFNLEIAERRVASTCGRIVLEQRRFTRHILVSGERFMLTRAEFSALADRSDYCIYFAPRSRTVLSLRPLVQSGSLTQAG
ncbi:MAG: hypothetical protein HC915_07095 [Anaerolineae bacterium]|nr:hypothetical protein [Anaerolineae bacterium]